MRASFFSPYLGAIWPWRGRSGHGLFLAGPGWLRHRLHVPLNLHIKGFENSAHRHHQYGLRRQPAKRFERSQYAPFEKIHRYSHENLMMAGAACGRNRPLLMMPAPPSPENNGPRGFASNKMVARYPGPVYIHRSRFEGVVFSDGRLHTSIIPESAIGDGDVFLRGRE